MKIIIVDVNSKNKIEWKNNNDKFYFKIQFNNYNFQV